MLWIFRTKNKRSGLMAKLVSNPQPLGCGPVALSTEPPVHFSQLPFCCNIHPSYSQTPPQHETYIPIWKRQVNMFPEYQRHFLRNVVSRRRGMPNLDSFFDICGVPQYVWKHAQEDSKIEPAEVAEYSAIEQAIGTWWVSNKTKPLYWIVDQLQAGFEELRIG